MSSPPFTAFAIVAMLFTAACGEESRWDKACGPDYGFEHGHGDNRLCFCETYDGRIYGPVAVSEEGPDTDTTELGAGNVP